MKITYDTKADAAYIRFMDEEVECVAHEISDDVILNLGPKQELVGIEILDASRILRFNPKSPSIELENIMALSAS